MNVVWVREKECYYIFWPLDPMLSIFNLVFVIEVDIFLYIMEVGIKIDVE